VQEASNLIYKGSKVYDNGSNSWKGRFYDGPISDIFSERAMGAGRQITNALIIGGLVIGYLAMVAEFGYVVALMRSGLLMREQFFRPNKFHPNIGTRYQLLLGGARFTSPNEKVWSKPFSFQFESDACLVTVRNFVVRVPLSRDPRLPIPHHLPIVPWKYQFRPDFRTAFD
jgi:hypothetical protein